MALGLQDKWFIHYTKYFSKLSKGTDYKQNISGDNKSCH